MDLIPCAVFKFTLLTTLKAQISFFHCPIIWRTINYPTCLLACIMKYKITNAYLESWYCLQSAKAMPVIHKVYV